MYVQFGNFPDARDIRCLANNNNDNLKKCNFTRDT